MKLRDKKRRKERRESGIVGLLCMGYASRPRKTQEALKECGAVGRHTDSPVSDNQTMSISLGFVYISEGLIGGAVDYCNPLRIDSPKSINNPL